MGGSILTVEPKDEHYKEKVISSFKSQKFMNYIGAQLTEIKPGFCEIQLGYREELSQHDGFFHGGIIGTLADNAGGFAAYSLMPPNTSVLTVEYKLNIVSPGTGEKLIAHGRVLKPGKTLTTCSSEVYAVNNENKKLCATSLMTLITLYSEEK